MRIEIEYDEDKTTATEVEVMRWIADCIDQGMWPRNNGPVFWRGKRIGAYNIGCDEED